MKETAAKKT